MRRHLSYANVMSTIAVFVAIGGTAFAAVQLGRNAVKTRHIAKGAVTTKKVKDGSLIPKDLKAGARVTRATYTLPGFTSTSHPGFSADMTVVPTKGAKLRQRPATLQYLALALDITTPPECRPGDEDVDSSLRVIVSASDATSSAFLDYEAEGPEPGRRSVHVVPFELTKDPPSRRVRSRPIVLENSDNCTNGQHFVVHKVVLRTVDYG